MSDSEEIPLAELAAVLSLAGDYKERVSLDHGLRSAVTAVRLARVLQVADEHAKSAYYLCMLRSIGSMADGFPVAHSPVSPGQRGTSLLQTFSHNGLPFWDASSGREHAAAVARWETNEPANGLRERCDRAEEIAGELGLPDGTVQCFGQLFERWDGSGSPEGLRGHQIEVAVLISQVALDAQHALSTGGPDACVAMLHSLSGTAHAPEVSRAFIAHAGSLCRPLEPDAVPSAALKAEPGTPTLLRGAELCQALCAIGRFADSSSAYFEGHSRGVAELAADAARRLGLPDHQILDVARAGHLHDLGRVGVPASVWDEPGLLTYEDYERIRAHVYLTDRILVRAQSLGSAARIASMTHERLDHSGYFRGVPPIAIPLTARVLAVADVAQALTEPRAYRAAHSIEAVSTILRAEAAAGRLDSNCVEAVLAGVGQPRRACSSPGGLSPRELQVVALVARGLTNKEIACELKVSSKTIGHHLQNVFCKLGVNTRAAAGVFAAQHGLAVEV